jgi:hypothetical protein
VCVYLPMFTLSCRPWFTHFYSKRHGRLPLCFSVQKNLGCVIVPSKQSQIYSNNYSVPNALYGHTHSHSDKDEEKRLSHTHAHTHTHTHTHAHNLTVFHWYLVQYTWAQFLKNQNVRETGYMSFFRWQIWNRFWSLLPVRAVESLTERNRTRF